MKLIYCPNCKSITSLSREPKFCDCRACGGIYLNGVDAEIWGKAIPLGIENISFAHALEMRPDSGLGYEYIAFVIPKKCSSVKERS